jgi:transposase
LPLRYTFEDEAHCYLPDFVARGHAWGSFENGGEARAQYVIEGGSIRDKAAPQELAKLAAAKAVMRQSGGIVIVVDADRVPARWFRNALTLHLRRFDYQGPRALLDRVRGIWERRRLSIDELVRELGGAHGATQVEAAAFKVAGDLLAVGRLDAALESVVFTRTTRVGVLSESSPQQLPPGIITDLDELVRLAYEMGGPRTSAVEPSEQVEESCLIDPDAIPNRARREEFLRRRKAIVAVVVGGIPAAQAAREAGLGIRRFQQLRLAYEAKGEAALLAHATYRRAKTALPKAMLELIERLYTKTERLGATAVSEHHEIHDLSRSLKLPRTPSVRQVRAVIRELERTKQSVREARAGRLLVPLSVTGRSIDVEMRPGFLCELDEATMDVLVVPIKGTKITIRLHMGAIICAGTRVPLSIVVSPKALDQWDYRRLLLRAIVSKDELARWAGCKKPWAASAIPIVLRADHGKINTCHLVFQAAADLPMVLEFAPVRDGHGKPFIESLFGGLKRELEHRLEITTKSSPEARGRHDPASAAVRLQVGPEDIEKALIRYFVDSYSQKWHRRLREVPASVWDAAAERFGVRTWQGSTDELRRLLKRDEGERLVERHGISYRRRWYGSCELMGHLRDKVRIKVDEDDLRAIDVYTQSGKFLCVAVSGELLAQGRPISRWELDLADEIAKKLGAPANDAALEAKHQIVRELLDTRKGDLAKQTGRQALHKGRAEESMDGFVRDAINLAATSPAVTPAAPAETLAPPVPDEDVYESLFAEIIEEVSNEAA